MAKAAKRSFKLDIFTLLEAADTNKLDFYDNLTEEEKKGVYRAISLRRRRTSRRRPMTSASSSGPQPSWSNIYSKACMRGWESVSGLKRKTRNFICSAR